MVKSVDGHTVAALTEAGGNIDVGLSLVQLLVRLHRQNILISDLL